MLDSIMLWILFVCNLIVIGALIYFASILISSYAIMKEIRNSIGLKDVDESISVKMEEPISPYLNPNTGLYDFHYGKKQQEGEESK